MVDQQYLLNDQQIQNFIKNGYITVHPNLPDVHEEIYRKTAAIFEKEGDPRNHILQKVPELSQVFAHPTVRGVLTSLLGPNYMMHPHRHAHMKQPGQKGGAWHQDGRSKHFTTKDHGWLFEWRRHHRFRSVWAWYYPQEVTEDMGPTAVIPGVQYYDLESMRHYNSAYSDPGIGALLCGKAGTITIGHYHQWHSSWGTNRSNKNRYMIKFLLTRTDEPQHPSWNANGITSTNTEPLTGDAPTPGQGAVWNHVWDWLSGDNKAAARNGGGNGNHVSELIGALHDTSAPTRLNAVYTLGAVGESAADQLIDALRQTAEPVEITEEPLLTHAASALSAIGAAAVPALISVLNNDAAWWVRATAADTLGDIGSPAAEAVPALIQALDDSSEWVRRNAVNALGTVGEGMDPLIAALQDDHPLVRSNAVSALARTCKGADSGVDAASRALSTVMYDDEYAIIREYAISALEEMGSMNDRE